MKTPEPRVYMGVFLMPELPNPSGIRWTARIGDGITRRADTLAGIKSMVRKFYGKPDNAPRMLAFLRMGSDYLSDSVRFHSMRAARDYFSDSALQLARFGQKIEASIHLAESRDALQEYPDYVLSVGPRGGIRMQRA